MGDCLQPVTKTYPTAPDVLDGDCEMFKQYEACSSCHEFPNGYPQGIKLQTCCGGKNYFIISNMADNNYDPCDYIGNTNPNKPWTVLGAFDFLEFLVGNGDSTTSCSNPVASFGVYRQDQINTVWKQSVGADVVRPFRTENVVGNPVVSLQSGGLVALRDAEVVIDHWYEVLGPTDFQGTDMSNKYSSVAKILINGVNQQPLKNFYSHFTSDRDPGNLLHHASSASAPVSLKAGDVITLAGQTYNSGTYGTGTGGDVLGTDTSYLSIREITPTCA